MICVSSRGGGYPIAPAIYIEDQIKAWKKVTDAVHAKGSFIFYRLAALDRVSMPDVLAKDGYRVISSSNIPDGAGTVPVSLDETGTPGFVADFVQATKNAFLFFFFFFFFFWGGSADSRHMQQSNGSLGR